MANLGIELSAMLKFLKRFFLVVLVFLLLVVGYVIIYFPTVMTGMDAKVMCSCVFVTGRTPESVMKEELSVFPGLTWADFKIDPQDSSVTASLLYKTSKAIYRKGLGCTLLAEMSEDEFRKQIVARPALIDNQFQDTLAWPSGNKLLQGENPNVNYPALQKAVDEAFADIDAENPINTHAVVVVYDGQLIAEKYAEGFDYNSRLMGWSMTKSVGNAIIGLLVKDGRIKVDEPAPIQEWQNDDRKKITINNLLQASTGLGWNEGYFVPTSDFHNMFIRSDDKARFAASQDLENDPGTVFEYSSGSSNILSRIARQELGDKEYYQFPYERLFKKIGMYTAILEPDASGTFVASSYCFASARDWARFGMLYLNDGVWAQERILPEGWVKYSTSPAPAAPLGEYGAQVWLNGGRNGDTTHVYFPGLPTDAYLFEGFEQNSVVVIPSKKLVVVRLGVTHNRNFNHPKLIQGVVEAISQAPLTSK
jgi:CubicO group peptidase (beta-lactamase class C family)